MSRASWTTSRLSPAARACLVTGVTPTATATLTNAVALTVTVEGTLLPDPRLPAPPADSGQGQERRQGHRGRTPVRCHRRQHPAADPGTLGTDRNPRGERIPLLRSQHHADRSGLDLGGGDGGREHELMAVATVGRRKKQREAADAAARQRRSRMMLIGLSVMLLVVAVIEVPKTLSKLSTSSKAAPASSEATTAPGATPGVLTAAAVPRETGADRPALPDQGPIRGAARTVVRDDRNASAVRKPPVGEGVALRLEGPFKAQLGLAAGDAVQAIDPLLRRARPFPAATPTGVTSKAPTSGYIVVLRSLPTKKAPGSASFAGRTPTVSRRPSCSSRPSTRHSATATGWSTSAIRPRQGATSGTQRAHGHGYPSAYRRIAKA